MPSLCWTILDWTILNWRIRTDACLPLCRTHRPAAGRSFRFHREPEHSVALAEHGTAHGSRGRRTRARRLEASDDHGRHWEDVAAGVGSMALRTPAPGRPAQRAIGSDRRLRIHPRTGSVRHHRDLHLRCSPAWLDVVVAALAAALREASLSRPTPRAQASHRATGSDKRMSGRIEG